MELAKDFLLILIGVGGLYWGAEWLVKGSSAIALRLGISPLVIGLTIVAFGTSAPELAVCVQLNLAGDPEMAIANVVGSNICNIALILGISALVRPIVIKAQLIRRDSPLLIGVSLLFIGMLYDGQLQLLDGIVLTVGIVAYVFFSFRLARMEKDPEVLKEFEANIGSPEEERKHPHSFWLMALLIVIGIAVLVVGAEFLKNGAVAIALRFGISKTIIGLTLVAIGTSLPELATSIVASMKNEGDIITGNAIGSSIFNILAVMGITILFKPIVVTGVEPMDLFFMLGFAAIVLPLMWTQERLTRREGAFLLAGYGVYLFLLVQRGAITA